GGAGTSAWAARFEPTGASWLPRVRLPYTALTRNSEPRCYKLFTRARGRAAGLPVSPGAPAGPTGGPPPPAAVSTGFGLSYTTTPNARDFGRRVWPASTD